MFPGADGLSDLGAIAPQVDKDGKPYEKLPPVLNNVGLKGVKQDLRFPVDLPNQPFRAEPYVGLEGVTGDAVASLLSGAVADRWRQDGQVRRLERRRPAS